MGADFAPDAEAAVQLQQLRQHLTHRLRSLHPWPEEDCEYFPRTVTRFTQERPQHSRSGHRNIARDFPSDSVRMPEENLLAVRTAVILGDAASGKSASCWRLFQTAVQRFTVDDPVPLMIHLGTEVEDCAILAGLARAYQPVWEIIANWPHGWHVFLDGFDEGYLNQERPALFWRSLCEFLREKSRITACLVTSRRSVWQEHWLNEVADMAAYQIDQLDQRDYRGVFPNQPEYDAFLKACRDKGIQDLLALPFEGFYLARRFRLNPQEPLPGSRRAILAERVEAAFTRARYRDSHGMVADYVARLPLVDVGRLRSMAQHLAMLAIFSRRTAWTEERALDLLGDPPLLPAVTLSEIRALLHSPLFRRVAGAQFAFIHQLYTEVLAAEQLGHTPDARHLLTVWHKGRERVVWAFRPVAIMLAEVVPAFLEWLMRNDPAVILLAEDISLPQAGRDRVIFTAIRDLMQQGHHPDDSLDPYGRSAAELVAMHRPAAPESFVAGLLSRSDRAVLLWGAVCARLWGGCSGVNDQLVSIALNPAVPVEIRWEAADAAAESRSESHILQLLPWTGEQSGALRASLMMALQAVGQLTPELFIACIRGGFREDKDGADPFWGTIHYTIDRLSAGQLQDVLETYSASRARYGDLGITPLSLLVARAIDLNSTSLSPELIVEKWTTDNEPDDRLVDWVTRQPHLVRSLWHYAMAHPSEDWAERERADPSWIFDDPPRMSGLLAAVMTPKVLGTLNIPAKLTADQNRFIASFLWGVTDERPSRQMVKLLLRTFPSHTEWIEGLAYDNRSEEQPEPDQLRFAQLMGDALGLASPAYRCQAVSDLLRKQYDLPLWRWFDLDRTIAQLSPRLAKQVINGLLGAVVATDFNRLPAADGSTALIEVATVFAEAGQWLPLEKQMEVTRYLVRERQTRVSAYLLRSLRERLDHRWPAMLEELLLCPGGQRGPLLHYLNELGVRGEAAAVLSAVDQGAVDGLQGNELDDLLDYLLTCKPSGYATTLRTCARRTWVANPEGSSRIIQALLSIDHESGWLELANLLDRGEAPQKEIREYKYPLPRNPARLPLLVRWYAAQKKPVIQLVEVMGEIDPQAALTRLEELRAQHDRPAFGTAVNRLTQMLLETGVPREPKALRQLLAGERVCCDERDLFVHLCEAVAELKAEFEAGEGNAAFWGDRQTTVAKTEPECQTILWQALRKELQSRNLPVVVSIERYIGTGRSDMTLEHPVRGSKPLTIPLELKVATAADPGPNWLVGAIESQLYEQYMRPLRAQHGLFVVLWFAGSRRFPTVESLAKAQRQVLRQLARRGIRVQAYIVDLTREYRRH